MTPQVLRRLHPDLDARRLVLALRVAGLTALVLWLAQPDLPERAATAPGVERRLRALVRDPVIIAALVDQNRRLASAPEAWTNAAQAAWEREAAQGGGAFLNAVLRPPASRRLQAAVEGGDALRHAALHDAAGRVVAAAGPLPGYLFDREPGWTAIRALRPGARHAGPRGPGHAGTFEACWITQPLRDAGGAPIGTLSLELDADLVGRTLCARARDMVRRG